MKFLICSASTLLIALIVSHSGQTVLKNQSDKNELFDSSDLVVVGKVVSSAWIVDSEKLGFGTPGKRVPWDPKEYVLATEVEVQVSLVLTNKTKMKDLRTVRILVPSVYCQHGEPCFAVGNEYLVFLNRAALSNEYKNAIALRSKTSFEASQNRFDRKGYFFVNGREWGAIGNKKMIEEYIERFKTK